MRGSRWENRYFQDNEDAFPNADKVFIDEKTNRRYTAPQRNRGGGGRESTKRKENAAALGRKAAAKKFKWDSHLEWIFGDAHERVN